MCKKNCRNNYISLLNEISIKTKKKETIKNEKEKETKHRNVNIFCINNKYHNMLILNF